MNIQVGCHEEITECKHNSCLLYKNSQKQYVWKKMKLEKVIYRMYLSGVSPGFRYCVRARDN